MTDQKSLFEEEKQTVSSNCCLSIGRSELGRFSRLQGNAKFAAGAFDVALAHYTRCIEIMPEVRSFLPLRSVDVLLVQLNLVAGGRWLVESRADADQTQQVSRSCFICIV